MRPDGEARAIATHDLSLTYGKTQVLRGIDLGLSSGKTLALLGPSGCGKTTLLRLVAGLLAPTLGDIFIDGRQVAGPSTLVPPEKRGIGMVFQDYALWPHLTVAGNVAFPLEMARVGKAERERRVMAALDRVGLGAMAQRRPSALSGGQQQRVAIARAIVGEPRIVLFDEPLSNLDRELRETMVAELGALIRDLGLTAIYVTHDQSEALTLADQVAVMDAGEIAQLASPEDLVEHPASPKVAEFLRLGAVLTLQRVADDWNLGQHPLGLTGGPASAVTEFLNLPAWDGPARAEADARLADWIARHGFAAMAGIAVTGTHRHRDGLRFNGNGTTWSSRTLNRILDGFLPGARRILVLDIHTGFGPTGLGQMMTYAGPDTRESRRLHRWFPRVQQVGGGQSRLAVHPCMPYHRIADRLSGADVCVAALEFGTDNAPTIDLDLIREESFIHLRGDPFSPEGRILRARMRKRFYWEYPGWKAEVLSQGLDSFAACLTALDRDGRDDSLWNDNKEETP